ncbi:meiosis regulator and mRNA stability factor 1 isoform X3 [Bombus bifarius]|uniref:Meiosis regulator and mRNA stability factor 1 n=1 Tax=Bombus bifarius TaxID=103933 RepID=A0A6P8NKS5_9HYME|nr:meiosis regulator and mRNA stability factor 1 isoform X3 [Bombus vancouverensis nearcticus]XP_033320589.1 meiosis regulator and mRNA stability factor 1 isoform X3 [Bombus bifarius]
MADQDNADYYALCTNDQNKTEGLNERLIETSISQSLCDLNSRNNSVTVENAASVSPLLSHYKYHRFSHHDSPVNFSSLPTYLPPIGVFWDIENCHVPKGRSAMAATQVIREKFFGGYREAEFIVVCDVLRENNRVMKELNNAQVNLIHVARECKNAADEKLKQSIRRFADIHGSPAAVILISGDINFAPDLSDLRYRKKIHVILLHMKNTSEALILCANEHYDFSELMESLPSTTIQVTAYCDLLVSNLPEDQDIMSIKCYLKQMFESCGGQVMEIQSNTAIVRFISKPSADRAQKRMDGKIILGSKISVKFQKEKTSNFQQIRANSINRNGTVSESEIVTSSPRQMYSASASLTGGRALQIPHYQPSSPVIGTYSGWNAHCASASAPVGMVQPSSVFVGRSYPNNSNNNNVTFNRTYNELARAQSPLFWQVSGPQQFGHIWEEQYKVEKTKVLSRRIHIPQARENGVVNNNTSRNSEGLRRIRGTQTSFVQPPEWTGPRQQYPPLNVPASLNGTAQSNFKRRSPSPMYDLQSRERNQWNGQNASVRSTRTPSPYENTVQTVSQQSNHTSPYHPSDTENEEVENFFNPINNHNGISTNNETCTPIELQVTNLDQSINPKKMRHMLVSIFMEHVMVLNVSIFTQSDGNFAASVKVPSLSDAQYAISQLHRRKVGYKRILISYAHSGRASPQVVRAQIVMLLQEVPGHKLPLFKFREMYESRFMISISVSELYKMKDVCIITEDPGGRMVSLNPDHRNTPSPCFNNTNQEEQVELPYCTIHTLKPWSDKGWAEQKVASLPNVKISLKVLDPRIHQLLTTHNGSLPLPSLPNCYEAEFKEKLQVVENGVPLEHLVSCLSCVELKQGIGSVKYLIWTGNKIHENNQEENKCVTSPLANQLALFSRELVDLLKTAPHCQLPFNRFIPAYHHHFGRQCRVADYGFTKLIDLLEALTHTVQVMGEGNNRVVTLSHRAQVRRFTSDLLRVLKSKASKQVALSEFPSVYARVIAKPWDIVDYGVCEIEDILSEVSENTVVVTVINGGDKMIAIPKREQTAEEIERTKQFAVEVVELLRHAPQCRMQFNKFVPSYHHHFGHQCRVSDYGFTKLIELFEAIPEIVKIEDDNSGERQISLTEKEGLLVLSEQISKLITRSKGCLSVSNIAQNFLRQFGYALKPELFGCISVLQLMQKLGDTVKIVYLPSRPVVMMVDKSHVQQLILQCRRLLMDKPQHRMSLQEFQHLYAQYYLKSCNIDELKQNLSNVVRFTTLKDEQFIELTPLHCFACNVYRVMMNYGGALKLSQFEAAYLSTIGSVCNPVDYGFPTLFALLQALPCTVTIKLSRRKKNIIYLNKKITVAVGIALPPTYASGSSYCDTDSSNESFESDSSSRVNVSNNSTIPEQTKWIEQVSENQDSWKQTDTDNLWLKDPNKSWMTSNSEDRLVNWSLQENGSESFLKNLIQTPIMLHGFPPAPPKPDSPPEEDLDKDQWESSVWTTPTKFAYLRDEHTTNVHVPPFTLPLSWNHITSCDSNLLSPTKNLLTAAANPLNPRTSPFFSSKRNLVVAPHPSELPLPSLSLTPKKNVSSENIIIAESFTNKQEKIVNSSLEDINLKNNENDSSNMEGNGTKEKHSTPTQQLFTSKRRLAAQFNRPIES